MANTDTQIKLLWAKSNREHPEEIHLLIYHLLESAAVGLALWDHSLSNSIKKEMVSFFNLPEDTFGHFLAYWIGLHDIGKAAPVFQIKIEKGNQSLIQAIRKSGLGMDSYPSPAHHSLLSGKYLSQKENISKAVEIAVSGHHGKWDTFYRQIHSLSYGHQEWNAVRDKYDEILRQVLTIPQETLPSIESTEDRNTFTTWLSGIICVADWIASNKEFFPYQSKWQDPVEYFHKAYNKAVKILKKVGWIGWRSQGEMQTFEQMYHFKGWEKPRDLQQQAITAYMKFDPQAPFIMIVEAPTGIGKTEIAMYLADQWLQKSYGSGMYIAMPTQATSNQLYHRSKDVLENRYKDQLVNLVLAHGQARWNEDVNAVLVKEVGEEEVQSAIASDWFQNNRKRTLLTPFGVGTVDQVFLSILQTKHFFVRLFGLKNKVVIFDEVHAYDTYMNTLFHRLLEWLRALGASVIILSATLPEETRKEIISHYCNLIKEEIPDDDHYPRVTLANAEKGSLVTPLEWKHPEREIILHWIAEDALENILERRLSGGGCAAVICNTVRMAQELYIRIKERQIVPDDDLILFHARFPYRWRQEIENKVLTKFGKEATQENGQRPQKAIVIATQVIEQSLDLDFDLMITELAPIDLMLQRAGRLHRHDRKGTRPEKIQHPELLILDIDKNSEGLPMVGERDPFYGKSTLLRTYYHLKGIQTLKVIEETRSLIEFVYSSKELFTNVPHEFLSILQEWQNEETGISTYKSNKAGFTTIEAPDHKHLLTKTKKNLREEDDINVLSHLKAKTRDGDLGIRVPCLFANKENELFFDMNLQKPVPKNLEQFNYTVQKELSQNEISISQIYLIKAILAEAEDIKQYIPFHKHQNFLKFTNEQTQLGGYIMILSPEIGFTFQKGGGD
ncbi:MAG: CRISPR-associated helicase Cas3' [Chloroflexota bacterium]|nr:CRISPR-associated helicase Cas3' [Chloroflexota bacterium]